jgi:AcrR family transcriptional regulator
MPSKGRAPGRAAGDPRWRRQPETRPRQILEAARRTFARKGFFGATLDDVARDAGITKGTIYLYYPSKQVLFVGVLRGYLDGALAGVGLEASLPRPMAAADLVRALVTRFYRLFCQPDYQAMVRLTLGEAGRFPDEVEALYRDVVEKRTTQLGALFAAAMERGEMRRTDPVLAARGIVHMVWGFAIVQRSFGGERVTAWPEAEVVETFTRLVWEGLAP